MSTPDMATPTQREGRQRVVLFLQGHPSRFWPALAERLERDGHRVIKVHFCLADAVFWGRRPALSYRGRLSRWASWVADLIAREAVTDVLYYADQLPYHRQARDVAEPLGVRCWAIEHGYLRPDWLTMEAGAMGAFSRFPRDRAEIATLAEGVPPPDMKPRHLHPFSVEAFNEVTFGLLQAYGRPLFPLYVSDKVYWPALDYLSWLPELALSARRERDAAKLEQRLRAEGTRFNLVAMQIQADYQIRASSPYDGLEPFLEEVFASFAAHAPAERELVIKLHPLDNGLERWFARIRRIARRLRLERRVHVIKGGNLGALLRGSEGVVLVNSTVGIHALRQGVPVCAMGQAVFDIDGLTHRGGLDSFWTDPAPVDGAFFSVFERALSTIQVKGSFLNAAGREAAIGEIARRLACDQGVSTT